MAKDKSGRSLEMAVARIQQMMDANSVVSHHEFIIDRLGIRREFDIVVRGTAGGHPYLGVIECKDWRAKVGTPEIEAFVAKARGVNANLVLLVSRRGFTKPALKLAEHEGVGTLSLLPDDPEDAGFMLGLTWYAKCYRWEQWRLVLHTVGVIPPLGNVDLERITLQGRPVIAWFKNELATREHILDEGWYPITVTFKQPHEVDVAGTPQVVTGLTVEAHRIMEKKQKWVRFDGDAYFDWRSGKVTLPPGWRLRMVPFTDPNLTDWKDFDGDIDERMQQDSDKLFVCCFIMNSHQFDPIPDAIDLTIY